MFNAAPWLHIVGIGEHWMSANSRAVVEAADVIGGESPHPVRQSHRDPYRMAIAL
jgi:hypothetical protein